MHAGCGECFARNFVVCRVFAGGGGVFRWRTEVRRIVVRGRRQPAANVRAVFFECCEFFIHLQPDKRDEARFPLIRSI